MHVRAEMEYRGAFILDRLAQILTYGAAYTAIWVLLNGFQILGGWNWRQLLCSSPFNCSPIHSARC